MQSNLKIGNEFVCLFFFSPWQSQIVTRVVIGYCYIIANGSSCYFCIQIPGWFCANMEGFMWY